MLTRRSFLKLLAASSASTYMATRASFLIRARAAQINQTPLPASSIPQFTEPIYNLVDGDHAIVDDGINTINLEMREHKAYVLPAGAVPNYTGTWVWSYLKPDQTTRPSYLGPVIVATRGQPTTIRFTNMLGTTVEGDPQATHVLAYTNSVDRTLHWADPLHDEENLENHMAEPPEPYFDTYRGPIPAVPHLHGGYVPPLLDGGPEAWFTSDGNYIGPDYYSMDGVGLKNYCIYRYPNDQEKGLIWFHDHTLGATRLNVYCGLAGAYLLSDPGDPLHRNMPTLVPLVIQDRMFDTEGQLFFPSATLDETVWALNPEHPFWVPEFIGDVIVVNGKAWPYMDVQRKRYTFLLINGSNARTYELALTDPVTKNPGPPLWVVGTDGGYLDYPVKIDPTKKGNNKLLIMPGERYWVIVDFTNYYQGVVGPNGAYSGKWIFKNTAKAPYPGGATPQGETTGKIMQFRVIGGPVSDSSYNPATGGALRTPMVRLTSPTVKRQLTLNEVADDFPRTTTDPVTGNTYTYPGGPMEVLVNNTKWDGKYITGEAEDPNMPGEILFTLGTRPDYTLDQHGVNYLSELPMEGTTEQWDIINTTADAHPIHLHLAQFQLISRQAYDVKRYMAVYAAAFPAGYDYIMHAPTTGGVYLPSYGPPLDYNIANAAGALGGNPDVTPFLKGTANPPLPQENGWKDTVMMLPGEVTRIWVRWAPQHYSADTPAAQANFPFDPRALGGGYVWHCHIVDHEDNEMMRPDEIQPNPGIVRDYVQGEDY